MTASSDYLLMPALKRERCSAEILRRTMTAASVSTTPPNDATPEPLWNMCKGDQSVQAELHQVPSGWEVRFFSNTQWFASQSGRSRELVIQYARVVQDDLRTNLWVVARAPR
jgi:hypothetical protein